MAQSFRINQRVEATVEQIFSFGVFARLNDGTRAYIRRRNLDLDADVLPEDAVNEGQRIIGDVVALGTNGNHIEISRRAALPDPWLAFVENTNVGEIVVGEVRRLTPDGAYIRVTAGVDGYLPLEEMAPWPVEKPDDLLWLGDRVEAEIISLSLANRKMTLSVRNRLVDRDRAMELFEGLFPKKQTGELRLHASKDHVNELISASQILQVEGKLLILEDDPRLRESLAVWSRRLGLQVTVAASIYTASEYCSATKFNFMFIDLNLPDGDGLEFAFELTKEASYPHIFIMSSTENIIDRLDDLLQCDIAQIFPKPLDMDEIQSCLTRISRGEKIQIVKPTRINHQGTADNEQIFTKLVDESHTSIQTRIDEILAQAQKITRAETSILFKLDPTTQSYTIQTAIGKANFSKEFVYNLGESPVKDVIRSGTPVIEGRVQTEAKARYQKLLELFPFESCMGLPIQVQDEFTHAIFFFHSQPEAFSIYRQRDARASAILIAALLEEAAADRRIQALSPILISGQLASGFGHEVANQISNLELELINYLAGESKAVDGNKMLMDLYERVLEIKETTHSFQRIMWTGSQTEACYIHNILDRAHQSVMPFARKYRTKIRLNYCPDLPRIWGNPVALQQVFTNILLNAIQQIDLKFEKNYWSAMRRIEVHTCQVEGSDMIEVSIQDTGPGIHRCLWKKIFNAGFSTRGGSGMGLYISRSIINQSGGTIEVQESLIPLGTTILIKLPVHESGELP